MRVLHGRFAEQKPGIIPPGLIPWCHLRFFWETNDLWAKAAGFCVMLGAHLSSPFVCELRAGF
jgi:hypothetical protein